MWILRAFVVHILLLGSIFVIYFRSPVITGQQPQESLKSPAPAKRLVLVVTDGLRAESFFHNKCSNIPDILSLILQRKGRVGVSHTRLPTESRPGHIALIAGLYEDPSAVTRGWKENPIDFDTVFNRSRKTYAFGANDVLHIFERMSDGSEGQRLFIDAYDHELDFSGREKTSALDEWVFKKVNLLLKRQARDLMHEDQVIFFLHLLGMDSAGHIHKPGSELFLENLHFTDAAIKEMYQQFEQFFPDGKTAYLLTSDHGMTNTGSHGSGDPLETETPFFIWGAGVNDMKMGEAKTFEAGSQSILPLYELEQAQMAPLMSALLGQPPPMNNFGMLPRGFLNVSQQYEAEAAHSNCLQFLEQFHVVMQEHLEGMFSSFLNRFDKLDTASMDYYKKKVANLMEHEKYDEAIRLSYETMEDALQGIAYYHSYYRNALLVSTTVTFIAWILYLLHLLVEPTAVRRGRRKSHVGLFTYAVGLTIFGILVLMQNVPMGVAFYLTLPIFVSTLALQRLKLTALWLKLSITPANILLLFVCAEFLVFTFFKRGAISLAFLVFVFSNHYPEFRSPKGAKFYVWLGTTLLLSLFPLLPNAGHDQEVLVLMGMLMSLARPMLVKQKFKAVKIVLPLVILGNAFVSMVMQSNQVAVSWVSQFISWAYLIYTFAIIGINRHRGLLKQRLELDFFYLTTLYTLFCTSYEGIFVVLLATQLTLAMNALEGNVPSQLDARQGKPQEIEPAKETKKLQSSLRLAVTILLYTFLSFFGTGNIASVSSFDPNIIRCFLTTFSPFTIMALVILKLVIPVLLNMSIIYANSSYVRANEQEIFICLLLICDVMGLNFLFLVRNEGSWLDIGSSISHFVIMEVTTLVLLVLINISKMFLGLPTFTFGLKVT